MNITSPAQLQITIMNVAEKVIIDVGNGVIQLLQERIMQDVYLYDMPNKYYLGGTGRPSYEFLRAFKWDKINRLINGMTRKLFYDWQSMKFDPKNFKHGSDFNGDMRQNLADLLNVEGYDSMNDFGGKLRRPYWDNFIEELFSGAEGGELHQLFIKSLGKYGFVSYSYL